MIKLLATLLLIHASLARASFDASSKGTTSADFLELGVGARAASMGEAYTAATGGAESAQRAVVEIGALLESGRFVTG